MQIHLIQVFKSTGRDGCMEQRSGSCSMQNHTAVFEAQMEGGCFAESDTVIFDKCMYYKCCIFMGSYEGHLILSCDSVENKRVPTGISFSQTFLCILKYFYVLCMEGSASC